MSRAFSHLTIAFAMIIKVTAQPVYVDINAIGSGDGTSWTDAFTSLSQALNAASSGTEIWVAQGSYTTVANLPFTIGDGVRVYGGFAGNETSFETRDWKANETILIGNDTYVVRVALQSGLPAQLDGFTITGGVAASTDIYDDGGGIYILSAAPVLQNLLITGNFAHDAGGGIYGSSAAPVIRNVVFYNNYSGKGGAAAFSGGFQANSVYSYPLISNCEFIANAASNGGAVYNDNCRTTVINSILRANEATVDGGALFYRNVGGAEKLCFGVEISGNECGMRGGGIFLENSAVNFVNLTITDNFSSNTSSGGLCAKQCTVDIYNSIVYGNRVGATQPMKYNVNSENSLIAYKNCLVEDIGAQGKFGRPHFRDSVGGDYRLSDSSDAIDYGDLSYFTSSVTIDAAGNTRVVGNIIDAGAYEYSPAQDTVAGFQKASRPAFSFFPNPAANVLYVEYHQERDAGFYLKDLYGRKVNVPQQRTGSVFELDLTAIPRGVYLIGASENSFCGKLIILK